MYFQVEKTAQPIATVDLPRTLPTLEITLETAKEIFKRGNCSVQIYKIPDGYTPQERILIIRMDWNGLK